MLFQYVRLSSTITNGLKMCVSLWRMLVEFLSFCIARIHCVPAHTLLCFVTMMLLCFFFKSISIVFSFWNSFLRNCLYSFGQCVRLYIFLRTFLIVYFILFFCYFVVCSFSHLNFSVTHENSLAHTHQTKWYADERQQWTPNIEKKKRETTELRRQ